jgi:hypothetical protein
MFKEVKLTDDGKRVIAKVAQAIDDLLNDPTVKDLPNTELEMTCNTLKALITEKFSDKKVENNLKK